MKRCVVIMMFLGAGCADTALEQTRAPLEGATTYRVTDARILDPHLYADPLFVGCTDVTDHAPAGKKSANEQLAEAIDTDGDRDDLIDFAVLLGAPGADAESGTLQVADGRCPEDDPNACLFDPFTEPSRAEAEVRTETPCWEPNPAHLSSAEYLPPVRAVKGECFVAEPIDFRVDLGDSPFLLRDARFAASYADDGTLDGILVGFLTRAEADRVSVKKKALAEYLPGGDDVCAPQDDTDVGPDGEDGWWMHIDFTAAPVAIEAATASASAGCSTAPADQRWPRLLFIGLLAIAWNARRSRRG